MISVIVPAYNARATIGHCIDSLMNQESAGAYEVIVVDDGSTDATPQILSGFHGVRLIRQENAGPASARNRGAAEAKGDFIFFTDADCIARQNWIYEMFRPFREDREIVGVKGSYRTDQKEIVARFVQLEYEDKYRYMRRDDYIDFMDTYAAGFKKDVFLEMNGYDTSFPVACAEDVELSYRLSHRGFKMMFNPDAVVYHTHPDSLIDYLRKKYKFAYWRMLALKKNPGKTIKDSHTPQTMKLQLLLLPMILGSALLSTLFSSLLSVFLLCAFIFVMSSLPFTLRACKKDFRAGVLSPFFLLCRSAAQFCGVLAGAANILKKRR